MKLTKAVLDHNKNNPEDKIKFPSAIDLHKWLVASIKPQFPWYYQSSKCAPQYALKALGEAWNRCFKKVSGQPNFKKKGKNDSFTLDGTIKVVDAFGDKKIAERYNQTDPQFEQTDTPKNVPQFFKPFPRDHYKIKFRLLVFSKPTRDCRSDIILNP